MTKAQIEATKKLAEEINEEEEKVQRVGLVRKINLYLDLLGHKLNHKPRKASTKETLKSLHTKLEEIEAELRLGSGLEAAKGMYQYALVSAEQVTKHVWNPLGWDLTGLGAAAARNKEIWEDLVTEFAIKHNSWFAQSVETRLIFATVTLMVAVDQTNKTRRAGGMPVPEEMKRKGEGL